MAKYVFVISIMTAIGIFVWNGYLSQGARECAARGGKYYLDGGCGTFEWHPR